MRPSCEQHLFRDIENVKFSSSEMPPKWPKFTMSFPILSPERKIGEGFILVILVIYWYNTQKHQDVSPHVLSPPYIDPHPPYAHEYSFVTFKFGPFY